MVKESIWAALSVGDLLGAMDKMTEQERAPYLARFDRVENADYGHCRRLDGW